MNKAIKGAANVVEAGARGVGFILKAGVALFVFVLAFSAGMAYLRVDASARLPLSEAPASVMVELPRVQMSESAGPRIAGAFSALTGTECDNVEAWSIGENWIAVCDHDKARAFILDVRGYVVDTGTFDDMVANLLHY